VATARKLAERVYRLLRYGEEYVCQQIEVYEAAYQARVVKGWPAGRRSWVIAWSRR